MKAQKFNYQLIILALILFSGIAACKKENVIPPSYTDYNSTRTIKYTVLVVPAGNTSFKSLSNDTAFVSIYMNNKINTVAADKNGLATFNNLPAGSVAVTIKYANHCTANLIVDLASKADTLNDNNNLRSASTMVALFPLSGTGTATVSGKIFADLNLTTDGLEYVPSGLKVNSIIEPNQFQNFVKHSGDGKIVSISYEKVIGNTSTTLNGDYSFQVPAAGSGLKIILKPDDFVYNQQITASTTQRRIFKPIADTITVFSGFNYFADLKFD